MTDLDLPSPLILKGEGLALPQKADLQLDLDEQGRAVKVKVDRVFKTDEGDIYVKTIQQPDEYIVQLAGGASYMDAKDKKRIESGWIKIDGNILSQFQATSLGDADVNELFSINEDKFNKYRAKKEDNETANKGWGDFN